MDENPRWVPLESNPEVMSKFSHALGLSSNWQFSDCFGLGDEELAWVPQPCIAVLLLYPYEEMEEEKKIQEAKIQKENQQQPITQLYFMKQFVENACGTIAVLHSLGNARNKLGLDLANPKTPLEKFLAATSNLSPEDRGTALGKSQDIHKAHEQVASQGQTRAPGSEEDVPYHFIAFVEVGGHLYEFDGAKKFPIYHGPTTEAKFLKDAVQVIKKNFLEKLPGSDNFSVITLGPSHID
eukprot:TRINITY_DN424_c0_g1_i1.p1 TRINITY_DN424_c0_g1~~TRINITY_DN424_c0_g1_i1.p1  ORF type:complete len:239 (+),score=55.15 TRINITY_DN424_c0_g1_i1:77-793(+)